jgi:glycosyltransferase involved in cell wall biosynthesis
MERIPSSAPIIRPVTVTDKRPLWSVMIPVYNCVHYIPEVLNSVLVQDFGEDMQIEVVDDASTDADVEDLVNTIGKGRITYFRQEKNVGNLRNFETCLNRAKGKLVHILHGDDRVKPGFYYKMAGLFQQYPEAGAAFCNYSFINEKGVLTHDNPSEVDSDGILENWLVKIAERQRIQFVAMVVKREVYEHLGGFYGVTYGEDWEMWVRIARHYPVAYSPEIFAEYRGHSGSLTWDNAVNGRIFQDMIKTIRVVQMHLPVHERKQIEIKSRNHCANYLIGIANVVAKKSNNTALARDYIKLALSFRKTPHIYLRVIKFYVKNKLYFNLIKLLLWERAHPKLIFDINKK